MGPAEEEVGDNGAGGEGRERDQAAMGAERRDRAAMMGGLEALPRRLTCSTPGGKEGWEGKGRTRGRTEVGWAERSGSRRGRLEGVTRMVRERSPRRAKRWVRARSASMCPCAGYGNTRMCAFVPAALSVLDRMLACFRSSRLIDVRFLGAWLCFIGVV